MKEALATVEICVLCGLRFLNHFDMVSETPYSCDTVGIPDINQCVVLRLGKVKFLNKLVSEAFWLLSLLNSRYSNGFRLTKTNFVFDLVSLVCRLRLLEKFFWIVV